MGDVVAAMRVGQEGFRAIRRPLHRALDLLRRPDADRLFRIDEDLGAEPAADVRRDDAQLVLGRDADEGREHEAGHVRVLARRVERVVVGPEIVFADGRAGLDGVRHQPVVDEVDLGHVLRPREGRFRFVLVAEMPVEHGVVGRDVMHLDRCFRRLGCVDNSREHVVIDHDGFRRVLRLGERLGDHHRHVVAHIAHLALGKRRVGPCLHRAAILGMDHPAADEPADLVGREVVAREDGDHARHDHGRSRVDGPDRRVGMRRAEEIRVGLARSVEVVDVASLAGDETLILFPADGCADPCCGHEFLPCLRWPSSGGSEAETAKKALERSRLLRGSPAACACSGRAVDERVSLYSAACCRGAWAMA